MGNPGVRLRPLDWFVIVNGGLYILMAVFFYWDRFVRFREAANVREFFVYACVFAVLLAWMWLRLRALPVRWALLGAGQLGLALQFAGGLYVHAGKRLYDIRLLPIGDFRFDKPVHLVNSIIVGLAIGALLRAFDVRLGRLRAVVIILAIVGVGALWEICEYVVVSAFPDAGVGGYDNNMQDMIFNLAGSFVYVALPQRWRAVFEAAP